MKQNIVIASTITILSSALLLYWRQKNRIDGKRRRRWWVRPINENRQLFGEFCTLFPEMKANDPDQFFVYTRMSVIQWEILVQLVTSHLTKKSIRKPLCPEHRLAITLKYLCHGSSMQRVAWDFRIGKSTASAIIRETCEVVWTVLAPVYLRPPTQEEYLTIATKFFDKWNFPHCCGAIDGKHILIQCPKNTGTLNFNHKGTFSSVLMAVSDADYIFRLVDIGAKGSESDGGIFAKSSFGRLFNENRLAFPPLQNLPGNNFNCPYFFIGDEAFPLKSNLMRPYPRRGQLDLQRKVFNYRLCCARRCIENTFGIMVSRFRILRGPIIAEETTVVSIVKAIVCLHNFIKLSHPSGWILYDPPGFSDYIDPESGEIINGQWRAEQNPLPNTQQLGMNRSTTQANQQREAISRFLVSDVGSLPYQYDHVMRGRHYR